MANIPDKPSLDGIEAALDRRSWDADGTYRFDRTDQRATRCSPSTPRRRPSAARCTSATCSATPTPTPSPASSGCAASTSSTRWAGTTTACATERRVQNYYGVRCDPSLPFDPSLRAAVPPATRRRITCDPARAPNFIELCQRADRTTTRTSSSTCSAASACRSTGRCSTPPSSDRSRAGSASGRSCATWPAARRTTQEAPTLWDIDYRTAVAQAEMEDREVPAPTTRLAFHARRDGDASLIDTTRPELLAALRRPRRPPRRRAVPAAVRHHRAHAAVRRRGAGRSPIQLAEPDKGTGIAMICTFGDTTDVTWWRELQPADAGDRSAATVASCRDAPERSSATPAGLRTHDRRARRSSRRRRAVVEQLSESGELLGEPRPITHPVKFYERATARSRSSPAGSGTSATAAATPTCAPQLLQRGGELAWHPAHMRHRYENWVGGPQRRLADQPPALLRRADPGVVPARRRRRAATTTSRSCRRGRLPIDPSTDVPDGLHRGPARPAGRLHRRPRRDGHVGDVVADPADRRALGTDEPDLFARVFPMDMRPQAPRHHPHLAVLAPSCAATTSTASCRGATPRCPAGSSTPTARRCRSRRATSSPRIEPASSSTAPTPSGTGRPRPGPASTPRSARTR